MGKFNCKDLRRGRQAGREEKRCYWAWIRSVGPRAKGKWPLEAGRAREADPPPENLGGMQPNRPMLDSGPQNCMMINLCGFKLLIY